jgi:hypothetical protein
MVLMQVMRTLVYVDTIDNTSSSSNPIAPCLLSVASIHGSAPPSRDQTILNIYNGVEEVMSDVMLGEHIMLPSIVGCATANR